MYAVAINKASKGVSLMISTLYAKYKLNENKAINMTLAECQYKENFPSFAVRRPCEIPSKTKAVTSASNPNNNVIIVSLF
jgi:hypothetical protein